MRVETIHLLCLTLALVPACQIDANDEDDDSEATEGDDDGDSNGDDGDDSNGDDGDDSNGDDGDDSNGDDGDDSNGDDNGDDGATTGDTSDDSADETTGGSNDDSAGDETPGDAVPEAGFWQYQESGGSTNDCTFIANPTNGWGAYEVGNVSASGFTIAPGDGTDSFECELSSGDFTCPERLVDTLTQPGLDINANVYVVIEGAIESSTEMSGSQVGHVECEGAECAQAEIILGVSFPCSFDVPFTGSKKL